MLIIIIIPLIYIYVSFNDHLIDDDEEDDIEDALDDGDDGKLISISSQFYQ